MIFKNKKSYDRRLQTLIEKNEYLMSENQGLKRQIVMLQKNIDNYESMIASVKEIKDEYSEAILKAREIQNKCSEAIARAREVEDKYRSEVGALIKRFKK